MRRLLAPLALLAGALPAAAQLVLDPVTVSATRAPEARSDVPLTVDAPPPGAFSDPSALTVDDVLGDAADFSLFRRNGSLTANPTSQGVSLRGLGPSGASRSLVLLDGVPLNDPFGGWVPWSLVPPDTLARAEIIPGGGASAWGNAALAGVIQLFSRTPAAGSGDLRLWDGTFSTRGAELGQALAAGPGVLELAAEDFATAGPPLIDPATRGPIDLPAASRHDVESARWRGPVGPVQAVVTLRRFDEWRDNGTPYQQNTLRELVGAVDLSGRLAPAATWDVTAYLQGQESAQTFSSVNAARTAETPADDQFAVPTTAAGAAATSSWTDGTGATTFGADFRDVAGETREDYSYSKGTFHDQRFAGGRQVFGGLFAERSQALGSAVHLTAGLRLDRWDDSDGHLRLTTLATGAVLADTPYPNRSGTVLSPSLGALWQVAPDWQLHAAGQQAFRQPTLNELYRPYRQGTTTTLANAALATEHADTAEVGATWTHGPWSVAAVGFGAQLTNPVANVTLAQGPGTFPLFGTLAAGATGQERLNLGRVDTRGGELTTSWAPTAALRFDLSALYEQATVGAAAVAPVLVGRTLPEVPRWSAALAATWHPLKVLTLTLRVRHVGAQYDDDLNDYVLAGATVVDASAQVRVNPHAEVFATADNLGNAREETAESTPGIYSIAPPLMVGGGVRLHW
jgi:outer membrane receptor protein involved in Fe transport